MPGYTAYFRSCPPQFYRRRKIIAVRNIMSSVSPPAVMSALQGLNPQQQQQLTGMVLNPATLLAMPPGQKNAIMGALGGVDATTMETRIRNVAKKENLARLRVVPSGGRRGSKRSGSKRRGSKRGTKRR